MSESNSSTPTPSDKTSKPSKPYPDFPLTPHPTRRWCKKIKGKLHYFGRWGDPDGALREYQAFLAGTVVTRATTDDNPKAGKPGKPRKPYPGYPLTAHPCGQWCKKIRGRIHYFGLWNDADAALKSYLAQKDTLHVTDAADAARRTKSTGKPRKPYSDFPLTAHPCGQWCKKIRGRIHYFGPWDDADAALAKYLAEKDALHAGRTPRANAETLTVKDVANAFLNHKEGLLDVGELSAHTFAKYRDAADETIAAFGKSRLIADLEPKDFAALRKRMAQKWGVYRLGDMIQSIRSIFKHGHDAGLLPLPIRFGPGFARPTKKAQRLHRAAQGPKLFAAPEIRRLIAAAGVQQRAMILLGINCGFGNADCAELPIAAMDLDKGIIDFPRPKTGIARRCPLWPETVAALHEALAKRHEAKNEEDAGLVFVTRRGQSFQASEKDRPIAQVMAWQLRRLGIGGRKGLGFYTLRHTFRTIGDEAKDQPAVDFIMGHEVPHMSAIYRETISDERLRAVADYVRRWLFPSIAFLKPAEAAL